MIKGWKKVMKSYKPLPINLTIKKSSIEGLGLFAIDEIKKAKVLGVSHIKTKNKKFKDGVIRTPLGGFINHSDEPNCKLFETEKGFYLSPIKNIKKDEELTVEYEWYEV